MNTSYDLIRKGVIMKDQIRKLYLEDDLSKREVAKLLNISLWKLKNLMSQYRIEKSKEQIQKRRIERQKKGLLEKYGVESLSGLQSTKDKMAKTCLEKYGYKASSQNPEIREKISKNTKLANASGEPQKKIKATWKAKYGTENIMDREEVRMKVRQKVKQAYESGIPQDKCYQTKKANNTLISSKSLQEDKAYELLLTRFSSEDIIRQYRSDLYPFKCDFYILSKDLYIECQFSHYHGRSPFNSSNPIHQKILKSWEEKAQGIKDSQFTRMIKVWTIEDPLKRKTAQENNLNWKEFFSLEEFQNWFISY